MTKVAELTQRVKDAVAQMNATVAAVKNDFEKFIVDQSIPLDERWQLWEDAPHELKDHQSWIVHFKNLHDDAVGYDGLIRHAERHETVHIDDLMESIEECFDEYSEGPPEGSDEHHARWYRNKQKVFEEFDLNALKEEILAMNLASFEYDW